MPIYDYLCASCGNRFEVRQGFSDDPGAPCLKCQGAAQRVMHPVGIVFKGSGWHSTDYRSRSSSNGSTGESSDSSGSSETKGETTKSESKTESKTERKSESKSESKSETSAAGTGSS